MGERIYPVELTAELREVLGMPNFQRAPFAHAFRDAGRAEIERRAEAEQAFVLHWLIGIVLEHGADWRKVAGAELEPVIEEARAKNAAKAAAKP